MTVEHDLPKYQNENNTRSDSAMSHQLQLDELQSKIAMYENEIERLHEISRNRDIFTAALVHDVRNMASSTRMSLELISETITLPSDIEDLHAIAKRNLDKLESMLRDLLETNQIILDRGLVLKFGICNFLEIVKDALDILRPLYGNRFQIDCREGVTGFWSKDLLRRSLVNLAANAVKYGKPGAPITIRARQDAEITTLSVHNWGSTISSEDQKELFVPFFRAKSIQRTTRGWGLGLPFVHSVIEAHGGSIFVESSDQEGTTFSITLPKDSRLFSDVSKKTS